jgi:hypothetical protein
MAVAALLVTNLIYFSEEIKAMSVKKKKIVSQRQHRKGHQRELAPRGTQKQK